MPRKDYYHEAVKTALITDGWHITHDPYLLEYGDRNLYVDLGASDTTLAAERANKKIAVEVKSFRGLSDITEWERALGQFIFYRFLMQRAEPDRVLYLAIPHEVYERLFADTRGPEFLEEYSIHLLLFDLDKQEVVKWMP
jgi:hypothetical protein